MSMMLEYPSAGLAASLVCGSRDDVVGFDPKSGSTYTSTSRGYGVSPPAGGDYGTLTPAMYNGFAIKQLYQADHSGNTVLMLAGNASALHPVLKVGSVNQNLGSGSYDGTYTTFTGTATDPFTGTVAVAITP